MAMSSGTRGLSCEINVTPLIDVLLVLLIIFMVITPITPNGLNALVPQPAKSLSQPQDNQAVVVQVLHATGTPDTVLKINNENTAWEGVGARLHNIFVVRAEKVLFVKGDDELTFDSVAQVIDIAHSAGVDKVGLITKRVSD